MTTPQATRPAVERASEDDARWFAAHPTATERRRPPVAGEFGPNATAGPGAEVEVHQVQPGARVRLLVERRPAGGAP